jgi:hypothetical protein
LKNNSLKKNYLFYIILNLKNLKDRIMKNLFSSNLFKFD